MGKKVDRLGRIVLPKSYREKLNLNSGDRVKLELNENCIKISKLINECALCGHIVDNDSGIKLCQSCILKVKKL